MRELPIIFSGPMVRAILDGRKTQTRRVVKPQPRRSAERPYVNGTLCPPHTCPHGQPGDRLYIREHIVIDDAGDSGFAEYPFAWHVVYQADGAADWCYSDKMLKNIGSKPSIHMPKWAARLWLDVTGVRVERLQDISRADMVAEGMLDYTNTRVDFVDLWNGLNAKRGYGWDANPWVWVIKFSE